ncbi:MAG: metallophosphoesterase [Candidatus Hodarchaeota archaeon]
MPDIRYVCLSDMHLGEEDSLLTNLETAGSKPDPSKPSPVLKSLVECLRYLIDKNENDSKPTLILNGDILELALALTNQAAMAFERFIELVMPAGKDPLFEHIVYIPGNHDHHIWEIARETKYVHYLREIKAGKKFEPPEHITKMFVETESTRMRTRALEEPIASYFLSDLVQRHSHLKEIEIEVVYPNFGLRSEDGQKCVIFHHGHFIESIYQLMTTFKHLSLVTKEPISVEGIEMENFAWIDFFWSTLGRSGEAGKTVESIYEYMLHPKYFKKFLSKFAKNLAAEYDLPGWGNWMEAKFLKEIFLWLFAGKILKREKTATQSVLSKDAKKNLRTYVEGLLLQQILAECQNQVPSQISFVFGHTHKPFQKNWLFKGYPNEVPLYNTGGWVVDTITRKPAHGGAIVLVDEELNLTSIRMYNESTDPRTVNVLKAPHKEQKTNPFHKKISNLVKKRETPFEEFAELVNRSVQDLAQGLGDRLELVKSSKMV